MPASARTSVGSPLHTGTMTESSLLRDMGRALARHEQFGGRARFGNQRTSEEGHDVPRNLAHRELSQILGACSRGREKKLSIADASLQSGEVGRLSGTSDYDVYRLIAVRSKTLSKAVRRNDVILRQNHDHRNPWRATPHVGVGCRIVAWCRTSIVCFWSLADD